MRLVHVVPRISDEASGPTYVVTRLCHFLESLGIDITLVTLASSVNEQVPSFATRLPARSWPEASRAVPGNEKDAVCRRG